METRLQGSGDSSPNRSDELNAQAKTRYFGKQVQNGIVSNHDGRSNGIARPVQSNAVQSKMESKYSAFPGKEKVMHIMYLLFMHIIIHGFKKKKTYIRFRCLWFCINVSQFLNAYPHACPYCVTNHLKLSLT